MFFTIQMLAKIDEYKDFFEAYLKENIHLKEPINIYEPMVYILSIGGKRLRPVSVFLGGEVCGGDLKKALPLALSIEVFHNFTLMHDDIMDHADMRRNKETVHQKWNLNTAILSGDAMMILTYQILGYYKGVKFEQIMKYFNETALEVCEGQQLDIDFESLSEVSLEDYMVMIRKKTGILLARSIELGALIYTDDKKILNQLHEYGLLLGTAFQLQDDYLDTFGGENFGKKIGGDILEEKKTFLYIQTLKNSSKEDRQKLFKCYEKDSNLSDEEKISTVKTLFKRNHSDKILQQKIEKYTTKCFEIVEKMNLLPQRKKLLIDFANTLMKRTI